MNVPYSIDILHGIYHETRVQYLEQVGPFENIVPAALNVIERNQADENAVPADLVPAVFYPLTAAMTFLEHPEVAARLPREVAKRNTHTGLIVKVFTKMALDNQLLLTVYRNDPDLRPLFKVDKDLDQALQSFELISNFSSTPFSDVRLIGGGAHKFMRRALPEAEPGETIARSLGLARTTAAIPRESLREIMSGQGRPYLRADNYRVALGATAALPSVDFSAEAHARIHPHLRPRRGCPAGRVLTPDEELPTAMFNTWARISRILLTNATTFDQPAHNPGKRGRKKK